MIIISKHNSKIKMLASLKEKKFREETGLFLVEGIKMVNEALLSGFEIQDIIGVKEVLYNLPLKNIEPIETTYEIMNYISDAVTSQGVAASVKIPVVKVNFSGNAVAFDRIRDPGNFGTMLRTLSAAGIKKVYSIDSTDAYSPKVVRSSMSGIFKVEIIKVDENEFLKGVAGQTLIAADMAGESVFKKHIEGDYCLMMGSESSGLSEKLKKAATETIAIPMKNNVESLNVGVSMGIILYQLNKNKF